MANASRISVELVYIDSSQQTVLNVPVPVGSSIRDVIQLSGILQDCPEIDLGKNRVGIYNEVRELDTVVEAGDRIEIYRPLQADPKEARRRRAANDRANPR